MKKICSVFGDVILCVMVFIMACSVYCRAVGDATLFFNYGVSRIVSGSMEPTIMTDGYVIFKDVSVAEPPKAGDILLFRNPEFGRGADALYCHRLVSYENGMCTTKGDNNSIEDNSKTPIADVKGKVVWIWNGFGPLTGHQVLIAICIVYIGCLLIPLFAKAIRPSHGRDEKNTLHL